MSCIRWYWQHCDYTIVAYLPVVGSWNCCQAILNWWNANRMRRFISLLCLHDAANATQIIGNHYNNHNHKLQKKVGKLSFVMWNYNFAFPGEWKWQTYASSNIMRYIKSTSELWVMSERADMVTSTVTVTAHVSSFVYNNKSPAANLG